MQALRRQLSQRRRRRPCLVTALEASRRMALVCLLLLLLRQRLPQPPLGRCMPVPVPVPLHLCPWERFRRRLDLALPEPHSAAQLSPQQPFPSAASQTLAPRSWRPRQV